MKTGRPAAAAALRRARPFAGIVVLLSVGILMSASVHAEPWIDPGDPVLRHDLQVLGDAGVLTSPLTQWPLSWPDIARDVLRFDHVTQLGDVEQTAFTRVRAHIRRAMRSHRLRLHQRFGGTNETDDLRGFQSSPRAEGELESGVEWMGNRFAVRLNGTAAINPDDEKSWRADGSYISATFWNLVFSAGYVDRWWGPGWDGSLILSTSARPIPAFSIERNYSDASTWPILKWFGRWRASVVYGLLEGNRPDFDTPHFFAARVAFRPWDPLEIGLSRSAQWCGDGRPCSLGTFGDLLIGRDNDQDFSLQPGNQLAGYDIRLSSPWKDVPVAMYGQMIGEDEAGFLPSKFLGLFGIEHWGGVAGGSYRVRVEYADTACSFSHSEPEFDCAYESSIYTGGYRYRDRSIGHSVDSDGRALSVGLFWVAPNGASWELVARDADVNRDAAGEEVNHSIASGFVNIRNVEITRRQEAFGGWVAATVGVERRDGQSLPSRTDKWRVSFEWSKHF